MCKICIIFCKSFIRTCLAYQYRLQPWNYQQYLIKITAPMHFDLKPSSVLLCHLNTRQSRQWLCLKSLTTPYIVRYLATSPFCSAVRMYSGKYYTLYSALKVSHNASRKVVYSRWSLTKQYLPSCNALRTNTWRFQFTIQLSDSGDVINGAGVVFDSEFLFLPMSSVYSPLCWTPYALTGVREWVGGFGHSQCLKSTQQTKQTTPT